MKITMIASRDGSGVRLICMSVGSAVGERSGGPISCAPSPKAAAFYHKECVLSSLPLAPGDALSRRAAEGRPLLRRGDADAAAEPAVRPRLLALLLRPVRDRVG